MLLLDDDARPEKVGINPELPWLIAAAAVLIAVAAGTLYLRTSRTAVPETYLDISTPPTSDPASFALSHDGRFVAFIASTEGRSRLWVRSLDSTVARPLPDTEGARNPFSAPDGRSMGFVAGKEPKRILPVATAGDSAAQYLAPRWLV